MVSKSFIVVGIIVFYIVLSLFLTSADFEYTGIDFFDVETGKTPVLDEYGRDPEIEGSFCLPKKFWGLSVAPTGCGSEYYDCINYTCQLIELDDLNPITSTKSFFKTLWGIFTFSIPNIPIFLRIVLWLPLLCMFILIYELIRGV